MFNRSSRYREVELKASITPDWLSSERDKSSFFPQSIRDWNSLTDSLISASEFAEDSVTTFTSLVRARD